MRTPLPPVACVVSFVHTINHGEVQRLAWLMTDDHTLVVLDEAPLVGKARQRRGVARVRDVLP